VAFFIPGFKLKIQMMKKEQADKNAYIQKLEIQLETLREIISK